MPKLLPLTSGYRGLRSNKQPAPDIRTLPLPDELLMSLPADAKAYDVLVQTGDQVLKGQPLTNSDDFRIPPIHASSSGTVTDITSTSISVRTDGLDNSVTTQPMADNPSPRQLTKFAHEAGLIGHGGAGFPLAAKLDAISTKPELLLINAAECDPIICCDDALITAHADVIIETIHIIARTYRIPEVVIGIEDNKPAALSALQTALQKSSDAGTPIKMVEVPAIYPSGAESILLRLCTDCKPEKSTHPAHQGILSINVATCYAFGMALRTGFACTQRVSTVVSAEGRVANAALRLGTTLASVYRAMHQREAVEQGLQVTTAGQMMKLDATLSQAVTQTTNCITFRHDVQTAEPPKACIRCGACADICPERLMPQQLHRYSVHFDQHQLQNFHIDRCIECRCCDVVCPSLIPLASQFHNAKNKIKHNIGNENAAVLAKLRYDKRLQRLTSSSRGKKRGSKKPPAAKLPQDTRKALIEAALARSRSKKDHDGL